MRRVLLLFFVALSFAGLYGIASAQQDGDDADDFTLRINSDYAIPRGERYGAVVVINADVDIAGTITDSLVVINGSAIVANGGVVSGDTIVINGDLVLRSGSQVDDVSLFDSDLQRSAGAVVLGDIDEGWDGWWTWGAVLLFGFLFWLGMTIAVMAAGTLFALVGSSQLATASSHMTAKVGRTMLTGLIVSIAIPALGILLMLTLIGIPAGVGVLLFLGPALLFLGYLVAGSWLGRLVLSQAGADSKRRGVAATILGLLILQVVFLVPGLGWAVFLIGGIWGTGALVYYALNAARAGQGASV